MTVDLISSEAEQAVIGSLLQDNRGWLVVGQRLRPEHFAVSINRDIVSAIADLSSKGIPFDFVTMAEYLGQDNLVYLCDVTRNTPGSSRIEFYADIVIDRFIRRQVAVCGVTTELIAREAESGTSAVAQVRDQLDAIENTSVSDIQPVEKTMGDWIEEMNIRRDRNGTLPGLPTGFDVLNERWGGMCEPDLIIIAGRPSMGKTALGMNIAEAAAANGKSVLVFSLEMSAKQLMDRRIASIAGVPLKAIRDCDLTPDQWDRVTDAGALIRQRKLQINDRGGITIDYLRLNSTAHKARKGLDLIVVDYLQLLSKPGSESRLQEVRMISKGLKELAKELRVPVVALSQLNRQCEARTNKRPTMADLRESGDIEQDADIISFVYRHEKYEPENAQWKGVGEIITDKHRNGEVGTDFVSTELHLARFANRDMSFRPPPTDYKKKSAGRDDL